MKIAVIGAGISGLTAAYLLSRAHDVEVFERNDYAGGHAHTIEVGAGGRTVGLETGFIVYNEHTYPGFTKLLRDLNVATKAGDMSLSVRCRRCSLEYSSRGLRGMLAQRSNALRPRRWALAYDVIRFYRDTRRVLREGGYEQATLAEFLRDRRYGRDFVRHFIVPLAAAVWSTPAHDAEEFPARYFLSFLDNHGVIGLQPAYTWRTVEGGSQNYVRAMQAAFPCRTRLSTPVKMIWRHADGVSIALGDGSCREYDHAVIATHADEALALLGDPSPKERRALGGFSYTANHVTLHSDGGVLPRNPHVRASWNYATADCRAGAGSLGMTFYLNRLQALDEGADYCVSLNAQGVSPDAVIAEMTYTHPRYTFETRAAQEALRRVNGERRTHYAGAHLGYGFHEDGLQSGVAVAERFGVTL